MRKITRYLSEFDTPKTKLARKIGITLQELYAYLEPQKYESRRLQDRHFENIARFEGVSIRTVREDYLSRLQQPKYEVA